MSKRRNWSLIGIPDHQGVVHVGGRVGAASGPEAFRRVFARLKGREGVLETLRDRGDVQGLSMRIEMNHQQAAHLVREAQLEDGLTVVVGGGHDHGYSHLLGISEALGGKARIGCINLDAHLDVRKPSPVIGSGSPFYLALEAGILKPSGFVEFGIQTHCNAPELWEYVESKKVQIVMWNELRNGRAVNGFTGALKKLSSACDAVVMSFDLDSVAQAYAPGVSAPQSEGFVPAEIIEMMEIAGSDKKVVSLGIFELNPFHDIGDITARLAATAAYHYIAAALGRK